MTAPTDVRAVSTRRAYRTTKQPATRTRSELVRAARDAFADQGYQAVSMQDLTESLGLTKGAFYHYFASKSELLIAVLEYIEEEIARRVDFVRASYDDPDEGAVEGVLECFRLLTDPSNARIMLYDGACNAQWDRVSYATRVRDEDSTFPSSPIEYLIRTHLTSAETEIDVLTKRYLLVGAMMELGRWTARDREARLDDAIESLRHTLTQVPR